MNTFNLDKHPKITSGFTTPKDYFEELPNQIMDKITATPVKKTKIFTLNKILYSVAAVLVLALSIPFFQNNSVTTLEQIDTNSLENYLAYQSNVSSYDLINLMEISEIDAIEVNLDIEDQSLEDVLTTNPNFENYIID